VEIATEQFKAEERQRVFGIIPNACVSYENDPATHPEDEISARRQSVY
jgi:hypothetical protein